MTAKTKSVKKPAKRKYKKRAKAKKKPVAKVKPIKNDDGDFSTWTAKRRACWSAGELPRACKKCGSSNSHVTSGPLERYNPIRTVRYRKCDDCGQNYRTNDCDYNKKETKRVAKVR